ncbi:MAG: GerW family sporulation protein [Candidatus Faecivivens sp.]|nr:GerW family sporulation protein [Oscillospiraceae bacterium]MDY2712947.1 GerW family sporulation protein [Candidatus Faecivivens sp.]
MADSKKVQDLMGVTMDKVKTMIDADSIIGNPITLPDGTTVIPVNRVSYGFASGGSDLPTKQLGNFAGGGGAGITMEPVAFLVIKNDSIRVMQINAHPGTVDKIVDAVPDMVDKVSGLVNSGKNKEEKE